MGRTRKKGKAKQANKERQAAAAREQQEQLEAQIAKLQIGKNHHRHRAYPAMPSTPWKWNDHGLSLFPPGDYLDNFTEAFLEAFYDRSKEGVFANSCNAAFDITKERYPDVWNDSTKLKTVISFFSYNGMQSFLEEGISDQSRSWAVFAFFFENYIAVILKRSQADFKSSKINDLRNAADEHTLVSFYRKRISCSCLDEKYKEVKSIAKMCRCFNADCKLPDRQVERSSTRCCSQCRVAIYIVLT